MPNTKTITIPLKPITLQKNHLLLIIGVIIIMCSIGVVFWAQAAFIQPTAGPTSSDQDFSENILGANNADNDFDSSLVVASSTGSIVERLKYMIDIFYGYSQQKNLIWDDWKDGASSTANNLAYAYDNAVDRNNEEGRWASTTDTDLGTETVASGIVKRDKRTGLYWSDCYGEQDGICDSISNSFVLDGAIADADDGLDAEGGDSVDFCESLSLDSDGDSTNETDWYLPSAKEIIQVYINGSANNIPNPDRYFCSSTEVEDDLSDAWVVDLRNGNSNNTGKSIKNYARCVRK